MVEEYSLPVRARPNRDPPIDHRQFLEEPLWPGMIYPTLYLTLELFERLDLPLTADGSSSFARQG